MEATLVTEWIAGSSPAMTTNVCGGPLGPHRLPLNQQLLSALPLLLRGAAIELAVAL